MPSGLPAPQSLALIGLEPKSTASSENSCTDPQGLWSRLPGEQRRAEQSTRALASDGKQGYGEITPAQAWILTGGGWVVDSGQPLANLHEINDLK